MAIGAVCFCFLAGLPSILWQFTEVLAVAEKVFQALFRKEKKNKEKDRREILFLRRWAALMDLCPGQCGLKKTRKFVLKNVRKCVKTTSRKAKVKIFARIWIFLGKSQRKHCKNRPMWPEKTKKFVEKMCRRSARIA